MRKNFYPLTAARIAIEVAPFEFWVIPRGRINRDMPERMREQGHRIWWFRWAWFQISYSRWL